MTRAEMMVNRWMEVIDRRHDTLPADKRAFIRRQFENLAKTVERYSK